VCVVCVCVVCVCVWMQIWDLASGTLKLTLTGHVNAIRGLAVSSRHPYMFSVGEDKLVKCACRSAGRTHACGGGCHQRDSFMLAPAIE
jgi:hypothetical protein